MADEINLPGFDVDKLQAQAEQVKAIMRDLFAELRKYDEYNLSPVNITGLTELNTSIKSAGESISRLNGLIVTLNDSFEKYGTTRRRSAATDKESLGILSNQIPVLEQYAQLLNEVIDLERRKVGLSQSDPEYQKINKDISERTRLIRELIATQQSASTRTNVVSNETNNTERNIQTNKVLTTEETESLQQQTRLYTEIILLKAKLRDTDEKDYDAQKEITIAIRERESAIKSLLAIDEQRNITAQEQVSLLRQEVSIRENASRVSVTQPSARTNVQDAQISTGAQSTGSVSVISSQTSSEVVNTQKVIQSKKLEEQQEQRNIAVRQQAAANIEALNKEYAATAALESDIAKKEQELAGLATDEAKRRAELTVQIREQKRALLEQAAASNPDVQRRVASEKAEADATKANRIAKQEETKAVRDEAIQKRQATKDSQTEERQLKQEAKAALEASNAYNLLKQRIREKENEYARNLQSAGAKSPVTKQSFADLQSLNYQLDILDKKFSDAGRSGEANFGRALTGLFSQIRTLAYILPGIGIAGIFNLIYEGVLSAVEALGFFNDKIAITVELQKQLAEASGKLNDVIRDEADLYEELGKENQDYYGRLRQLEESRGLPYEKQLKNIDTSNKLRKEEADNRIKDLTGIEDYNDALGEAYNQQADLNGQLKSINDKREEISLKIIDLDNKLKAKRDEKVPFGGGFVQRSLEKAGEISGLETLRETMKTQLESFDTQVKTVQTRSKDLNEAIKGSVDSNTAIEEENLKRQKYFADESRKIRLDRYKNEVESIKQQTNLVLHAPVSDTQQRLNALGERYEAEKAFINKNEKEIANDISKTDADRQVAHQDAAAQRKSLLIQYNNDASGILKEFELKYLDSIRNMTNEESEIWLKTNEAIFQDEKRSLNERLNALGQFIQGRKRQVEAQANYERNQSDYQFKTPEQKQEVDTKERTQKQTIDAESVRRVRDITHSYVQDVLRDLKQQNQELNYGTTVEQQYTAALTTLDTEYERGALSYRKYAEARKSYEYHKVLAVDEENVGIATTSLKNDQEALRKNNEDIKQATIEYSAALITNDENVINQRKAKLDELAEGHKKINLGILADDKELAAAQLKLLEDKAKAQAAIDQAIADNWKKIGDELFELFKEIVDAQYEKRIESTERQIEAIDKMYDHEVEAIERSTLANKDKTALEIQNQAQKTAADEAAARKLRKLRHDEAVADKAISVAKIIWDTQQAYVAALASASFINPIAAIALANTFLILGGIAAARAAAAPVPSLATGTDDWKGGIVRVGEAGTERIKEPGKVEYYVNTETIKYLPPGTQVIPTYSVPTVSERTDESWQQTRWLASVLNKQSKKSETKIINNINVDLGWENYKRKIIYGYTKD